MMTKCRRFLASLLAALLLAAALPPGTARAAEDAQGEDRLSPASLLPLPERHFTLNAEYLTRSEIKNLKLTTVLTNMEIPAGSYIAWTMVRPLEYEQDRYELLRADSSVDLTEDMWYKENATIKAIAGPTADQLDSSNVIYVADIIFPSMADYFDFTLYSEDHQEIELFSHDFDYVNNHPDIPGSECEAYLLSVDERQWSNADGYAYLCMRYAGTEKDDLDVTVYKGLFTTEEEARDMGAEDITAQIWGDGGGYWADYGSYDPDLPGDDPNRCGLGVTVVARRNGRTVEVMPVILGLLENFVTVTAFNTLYTGTGEHRDYGAVQTGTEYPQDEDIRLSVYTYQAVREQSSYYVSLKATDDAAPGGDFFGAQHIQKAVLGACGSAEEMDRLEDIKEQLFSDASSGAGYKADFSAGSVTFTVLDTHGGLQQIRLVVKAGDGSSSITDELLPALPTPLNQDTYFRMAGLAALDMSNFGDFYQYVNCTRLIGPDDDSYYYNGYQTLFVMEYYMNAGEILPVIWDQPMTPLFFTENRLVNIYAGSGTVSGENQIVSGEELSDGGILCRGKEQTFRPGVPVQYSAASPNETHLKNYWITFLSKEEGGAKLFVNAADNADAAHRDQETGLPVREVYLDKSHGHRHDVAFLNIGDEPLTGLSVKLAGNPDGSGEAVNVKLDDYWTIRNTDKLDAFDEYNYKVVSGTTSFSAISNMAKIRLVPVTDADGKIQEGDISGYLIISSDNGGSETIKLTGSSRTPEITTRTLSDGVKYVPYSSLIQTNNMYESNIVKFELVKGTLPDGVILRQNGEIYGVPKVTGSYDITVRATFFGQETQEVSYTLVIRDNTDDNVWNATDADYTVTTAVGRESGANHYVWSAGSGSVFTTNGSYGGFLDFYLDGRKLEEGVDYDSREGSTVITIRDQTLSSVGAGTHTLAAEFREGNRDTGKLKRAAQNYTIETAAPVTPVRPVTGTTAKPATPSQKPDNNTDNNNNNTDNNDNSSNIDNPPKPSGMPYTDTPASSWFYDDVKWAYDEGLMTGVSNTAFSPGGSISQAIIVTVLARMAQVDLTQFQDAMEGIEPGKWYTGAAVWAKQAGLLPDYGAFTGDAPISRDEMAIMLVKYLRRMGKDAAPPAQPIAFADADAMSQAGNDAFQVLYAYNIFRGIGDGRMDPDGTTTRAQFAALVHRLSDTIK